MADPVSPPAWKRHATTAGAMMLLRGHVRPLATCDHCGRPLAGPDGTIDVAFVGLEARFACPSCSEASVRPLGPRGSGSA